MIKYKAWFGRIEPVEIEKETDSSVWIKGNRQAKVNSYAAYCDSWEQAHKHLLHKAEIDVIGARKQLEYANSRYGNIKGLKPPKE